MAVTSVLLGIFVAKFHDLDIAEDLVRFFDCIQRKTIGKEGSRYISPMGSAAVVEILALQLPG